MIFRRIDIVPIIGLQKGLLSTTRKTNPFRFDHEKVASAAAIAISQPSPVIAGEQISLLKLPMVYARLCKTKLSGLVVCTTLAGYLISPSSTPFLSQLVSPGLWSTLLGTALCAGAANGWNQWAESAHDAKMVRTRMRPLPTKQISSMHAFGWSATCAAVGLSTLWLGASPLACGLAATTIGLYTLVYTPLKRYSVLNTWVGAFVGGIPPLIGFAGALGPSYGLAALLPDAALLGAILYCWQFPHFNALSHNLRQDYNRAGYCMAAIHRPALNKASALVHAAALIPLTVAFSPLGTGLCSSWILLDGGILAAMLTYLSGRFYYAPSKSTARRLFLASLLYLPAFLALLVAHQL